jgi:phenylalanyl-tRNA synthetase alpha chain
MEELHPHEKLILKALEGPGELTQEEIAKATGLPLASVSHACLWLNGKGLARLSEEKNHWAELNDEGRKYLTEGLPERQAMNVIREKALPVEEVQKKLGAEKAKIAFTWLMKKRLAAIKDRKISLTPEGLKAWKGKTGEEKAFEKLSAGRVPASELPPEVVEGRGKIINKIEQTVYRSKISQRGRETAAGLTMEAEVNTLTPQLLASGKWKDVKFRPYDIRAPAPPRHAGRRHFVKQAVDYVRRIWLEMGFKEMQGPLINTSFWNFDALFVPQEHPARELQDTFFVTPEKGELPDSKLVARVKKAHEVGTRDSLGWNYSWSEEVARLNILRTHTTVLSARTIAALKKEELPAKYFAIGRCFRNEALDWKHLFEFNQVEGIVVAEDVNFKHLLGYLKTFFGKLGFANARFRPHYFPYTEMSVEIDVLHPLRKQWVELGGAGIFRPEVVEPLLGEPLPVLAWGPGFDRIIMDYYSITDIRDLYKNDVGQMRSLKQWTVG